MFDGMSTDRCLFWTNGQMDKLNPVFLTKFVGRWYKYSHNFCPVSYEYCPNTSSSIYPVSNSQLSQCFHINITCTLPLILSNHTSYNYYIVPRYINTINQFLTCNKIRPHCFQGYRNISNSKVIIQWHLEEHWIPTQYLIRCIITIFQEVSF